MLSRTAIVFGAGKIARGFIAHLLARSGYQIRFVEKDPALVELLRRRRRYRIEIMGAPEKSADIEGFEVLASDEAGAVADSVAECPVVFVSVGGPNLPEIAPLLSAGIRRASARNRPEALNVLICENYFQPAELIRHLIETGLAPEERQWFRDRVGLVETMVLRSTIEPTEEMKAQDPLSLKSQDVWELPCDREAFKGEVPAITGLAPQRHFQHALLRKLFTYNSINAVIAYAGYLKGHKLLSEAANDPEIIALVEESVSESSPALCKRYGFDPDEQRAFAGSALAKYQRQEIVDPIERNARDPIRKLGRNDRLVGPAWLAFEEGIQPVALCRAIGMALHYDFPGDPGAEKLQASIRDKGLLPTIHDVCGINDGSELASLVAEAYQGERHPQAKTRNNPVWKHNPGGKSLDERHGKSPAAQREIPTLVPGHKRQMDRVNRGPLRMLRPRPPLHKEVADIIAERIIEAYYPPNSYLPPERELCEKMGVSLTVVREAMKLLESAGLVSIRRGLGTMVLEARNESVSQPLKILLRRKAELVRHLLEVRKILEVAMAGLAAERRSDENLSAMESFLQIMRDKPNEPEGYIDADLGFHAEIVRAAKNPTLSIILGPLGELLRESRAATFSGPEMVEIRRKQHEQILGFIRRGDAEAARTAMSQHLSDTEQDLARHDAQL